MSGAALPTLRRHQLARLHAGGWRRILAREWPAPARGCLEHWAAHDLPLVVTRQPAPGAHAALASVALGLAAPARWGRRPMALQVASEEVASLGEFPTLADVVAAFPAREAQPLQALAAALQRLGVPAHAYGSAGWQQLSGLTCLHPQSDLDLWLGVRTAAQADSAADALAACGSAVRLDGELMFDCGSAVAWREWAAWRGASAQAQGQGQGGRRQVLVKRLHGPTLVDDPLRVFAVGAA